MKVKDLIKELKKQDPDKEVMIQQGEEYDYEVVVHSVETRWAYMDEIEEDVEAVVLGYE